MKLEKAFRYEIAILFKYFSSSCCSGWKQSEVCLFSDFYEGQICSENVLIIYINSVKLFTEKWSLIELTPIPILKR